MLLSFVKEKVARSKDYAIAGSPPPPGEFLRLRSSLHAHHETGETLPRLAFCNPGEIELSRKRRILGEGQPVPQKFH
jgi:hypothetical protein